jgi:bifunctional non-homologous end joining protein LigD
VYEEKVDGWRMVAYKAGDRVRLVSRNRRDHTRRFHDSAAAISNLLDGEVAIYDQRSARGSTGCVSRTRTPSPRRRSS